MLRRKLSPVLYACLTAVTMSVVTVAVAGFTTSPSVGSGGRPPESPRRGREVIKIVNTIPGSAHGYVTAKGAFTDQGYFLRKRASLVFPKGRLTIRRHVVSTVVTPPNLATCWFKIRQTGTFQVVASTGAYSGLRYGGHLRTNISGRLNQTGHDQCGSKVVFYRTVTYEIGNIP